MASVFAMSSTTGGADAALTAAGLDEQRNLFIQPTVTGGPLADPHAGVHSPVEGPGSPSPQVVSNRVSHR